MRLFKLLFIFLIGMIMNTSMASTPLMEANQKATFAEATVSNVQAVELTSAISFDFRANPEFRIDFNAVLMPSYVSYEFFVLHIFKEPKIIKASDFVLNKQFRIRSNC